MKLSVKEMAVFGMLGAVVFAVLYLPLSVIFALTGKYR